MTTNSRGHLGPQHPLAPIVKQRCRAQGHTTGVPRNSGGLAAVGCGRCWEEAIRADERLHIEEQLPHDCPRDPRLIDEIAIERVLKGDTTVRLTRVERIEVVKQLRAGGRKRWQICEVLNLSNSSFDSLLLAASNQDTLEVAA